MAQQVLTQLLKVAAKQAKTVSYCFVSFPFELAGWQNLMLYVRGELWSQGALWESRVRYAISSVFQPILVTQRQSLQ